MDISSTLNSSNVAVTRTTSTAAEPNLAAKKQDSIPLSNRNDAELNPNKNDEVVATSDTSEMKGSSVDSMLNDLNKQMQRMHNYLKFERDEDSRKMVILVKDAETNEVVRQIPSEEFLKMAKSITDYLASVGDAKNGLSGLPSGLLTNQKV